MMNKGLGVLVFLALFLSVSLVSAQAFSDLVTNVQSAGSTVYEIFEPVLKLLVGADDKLENGEFLAKILFLLIVFAVAFIVLEKVPLIQEHTWALWVIGLAVSFLSVRWISDSSVIQSIILPYSALGVTLSAGIPFFLYFFVVKDFNRIGRKIAWIFFAVIFVGLWIMRYDKAGNFSLIYLITAVVALVILTFDKSIQRAYKKSKAESNREIAEARIRAKLTEERAKLEEQHGHIPDGDWNKLDENLTKREKKHGIK